MGARCGLREKKCAGEPIPSLYTQDCLFLYCHRLKYFKLEPPSRDLILDLVSDRMLHTALSKLTRNHLMLKEEEGGLSESHFRRGRHQDTEVTGVIVWQELPQ